MDMHAAHQPLDKTYSPEELAAMPEDKRWQVEHQMMHEKHRGHEQMHVEMMLILIAAIAISQILLVQWRKWHFKSYQMATLAGMWVIPVIICLRREWYRFIVLWSIFSCLNTFVTVKATRKHVSGNTPRLVYKWFLALHKLSYVLGIIGYFVIIFALVGINLIFGQPTHVWMDFGMMLMFYGLYYGVLGRDFAEICTDTMAAHVGYYTRDGLPKRVLEPNVCAICGTHVLAPPGEEENEEKAYKLTCSHLFHEFCIRGWCVVGKKQTCPYCKEKVDLKRMFTNPWEKPHLLYGQLLDWIRYLVAWQPVIITTVQGVNYVLGLE